MMLHAQTCLLLGAMLLAAGCEDPTRATAPGNNVLVIALQADGKTLDPHTALDAASMRLIENMYDTLMRYSADYPQVEPSLAEQVTVSEDGLTYTFVLKAGVRFHDGAPLTSEAVAYSLRRIKHAGVRAQALAPVDSIRTPDERTVVLELSERSAPLLTHLAHPMNAIVNPAVVEANAGRLDRADAGSGPFKLQQWRPNQHLILSRHDAYHVPGLPRLNRLIFQIRSDETARTIALRTGEVDLVLDVPAKDLVIMERLDDVNVQQSPGTFFEYIGLNTRRPPLDDPRVRQAIAWAVDRAQLNRIVKFGRADVLEGGHIPAHHWAYLPQTIYGKRELAKARQLLAEAGLTDALQLSLTVGADFPYQVQAAEIVKQQLLDAGIEVKLQMLESGVFFDDLGAGDFDMTLVGWVGFVDPDQWMWDLFHSRGRFNQQGYANREVDDLLDQGRSTLDRDRRRELYQQAQRIVAKEAPMVFLYLNPQVSAMRRRVRGFKVHPTASTLSLRDAWVDEP